MGNGEKIGGICTKKLIKNVVTKPFKFRVKYKSGKTELVTVSAESREAAILTVKSNLPVEEIVDAEKK